MIDLHTLRFLMEHPVRGRSVEYNDNRLSLFSGQYGKCAITGEPLRIGSIRCHHKNPRANGGTDEYKNLILITEEVHRLVHATDPETIRKYLAVLSLDQKQRKKLNSLRKMAGNDII